MNYTSKALRPLDDIAGRSSRWIAVAIVALGFGLRLFMLASESLWYDELLQLDIAQGPLLTIFPRLRGHSAVPLDYLIGHFWIALGRDDGWVRLPAVMAGTLTLPLSYQLGRWLLGRIEGLLLMAILALSPFHIHFSQEVRPYALVVLGVTLTVFAVWRMRETGKWRYFVPMQLGLLIFSLAHIFAAAIFVPLFLLLVLDFVFGRNKRRVMQLIGALLLSALLPLLIFGLMGWGDVLYYSSLKYSEALIQQDISSPTSGLTPKPITGPKVDWPFVREQILAPFSSSNSLISLAYFNGLVILGLVYLLVRRRFELGLALSFWLVFPPLVIVTFLIFRDTFFAPRYIISILPAYLILLTIGLLALPRWLGYLGYRWLSVTLLIVLLTSLFFYFAAGTVQLYRHKDKEDWHLVGEFIANNAQPNDAVIAFRAEPSINWYYPSAWTAPNYYGSLESIQAAVARAERSWIILSLFSSGSDAKVKAWLSEQQAVRFVLDPIIHVYYLGNDVPNDQLLAEIQGFALPVDHALYASLARENRRRPDVARQYFRLAMEHAPDAAARLEYELALEALARQ